MQIVVQKFGGTSVQDWEAMRRVMEIVHETGITRKHRPLVVLSACAGVTNQLIRISELALRENTNEAVSEIHRLVARHEEIAIRLVHEKQSLRTVLSQLDQIGKDLQTLVRGVHLLRELSPRSRDQFQSVGERCSTLIFAHAFGEYLRPSKIPVHLYDARQFFITSTEFTAARPDIEQIEKKIKRVRTAIAKGAVGVTQGFIGSTPDGITTTIGRGGSDFSAAIMGVAADAQEIQIWTDVAGIMTCDPRVAPKASTIPAVSFDDASALAFFGAKVLHPETIWPAVQKGIPVRVLSSKEPKKAGTVILGEVKEERPLAGIAVKKNITVARIASHSALPDARIQQIVWEALADLGIVPMAVSLSADSALYVLENTTLLSELRTQFENVGDVLFEKEKALITLVGRGLHSQAGIAARVFSALGDTNCEMISYGGSPRTVSFVVEEQAADHAMKKLHTEFFE